MKGQKSSLQDSPKVAQLLKEPFGTEAGAMFVAAFGCVWHGKKRVKAGLEL